MVISWNECVHTDEVQWERPGRKKGMASAEFGVAGLPRFFGRARSILGERWNKIGWDTAVV